MPWIINVSYNPGILALDFFPPNRSDENARASADMPLIRGTPAGPVPSGTTSLLRTGTADERRSAARALGAEQDGTKTLGEALNTETDPRVREAIFTSLIRLGGKESVDAVVPFLRVDDANLRMGALDALRAMIGTARQILPLLLTDPDPDIRLLSCDLLRELPSPDATRLLCDVLAREPEPNVCAAAVDVLADIGDADALPFLRNCAARFGEATFLTFAVKIAMERIVSERPAGHG
jgi:HEAT repeat protein